MLTIAGNVLSACDATGLLWAAVTLTLACAQRRGCGSMFRSLVSDETGGSYMAGAVMVFPLKIMLIAIVVELTMLLIALGGTFYASYVTARSAVVWLSAAPRRSGPSGSVWRPSRRWCRWRRAMPAALDHRPRVRGRGGWRISPRTTATALVDRSETFISRTSTATPLRP